MSGNGVVYSNVESQSGADTDRYRQRVIDQNAIIVQWAKMAGDNKSNRKMREGTTNSNHKVLLYNVESKQVYVLKQRNKRAHSQI